MRRSTVRGIFLSFLFSPSLVRNNSYHPRDIENDLPPLPPRTQFKTCPGKHFQYRKLVFSLQEKRQRGCVVQCPLIDQGLKQIQLLYIYILTANIFPVPQLQTPTQIFLLLMCLCAPQKQTATRTLLSHLIMCPWMTRLCLLRT